MDYMVRGTAAEGMIRAFAAATRDTVEEARKAHNTAPVATAALGRLMTAAVMMGSDMKGEQDLITLKISCDGPIGGLLATADAAGNVKGYVNQPEVLVPVLCHMALPTVLIMLQGDDGSALIFLCIGCGMLFAAGIGWKYILAAGGAAVAALPVIWYGFLDEDKRMRFITLFNPELDPSGGGYQQRYGRIALGSGKLWGKGIFSGNHQYVPEMYNDFIFSFIGEALGFLGCLAVLGLLAALCLRILRVGNRAKDSLGRYICVGVFTMIASQTVVNVGMCLSVLPVIGVTLPLFSGGGTSVVATYLGVGLAVSVAMHNSKKLFTL